jgi:hypothetical protein
LGSSGCLSVLGSVRLRGHADANLPPRATLRLLADRLVELQVVESVSYETVRQALKHDAAGSCGRAGLLVGCRRARGSGGG